jgi:hypothetical protein
MPERAADAAAGEDGTLVTLARGARARAGAPEGAAVRDAMGRTYAAASLAVPRLTLGALQGAVAAALSSGADRLESAVVVRAGESLTDDEHGLVQDLGVERVLLVAPDGRVVERR